MPNKDGIEIHYETIPDGRRKHEEEAPLKEYKVASSDFFSEKATEHELAELRMVQQDALFKSYGLNKELFDGHGLNHYQEWGRQEVKYTSTSSKEQVKRLQARNDAYTMTMLMNCVGPLRQGISVGSLMQVWISYQTICTFNENMDMDVSRLCSNMRQDLERMKGSFESRGPGAKFVFGKVTNWLDGYLASVAGSKLSESVEFSMRQGTLDEMVMTPKQLAALKVSFMEQYYFDMRNPENSKTQISTWYNNAILHLENIATNSGFDMSVVAAEERHIVGLKIKQNPDYANLFNETAGAYGAQPMLDDDGKWSDKFVTADEHAYTVGGKPRKGAFTVRMPEDLTVQDGYPLAALKDMSEHPFRGPGDKKANSAGRVAETAREFASMVSWANSDACRLKGKDKQYVLDYLAASREQYKTGVLTRFVHDGAVENGNNLVKLFDQEYQDTLECGTECQPGEALQVEMDYILNKEILGKAGMDNSNQVLMDIMTHAKGVNNYPDFLELKKRADRMAIEHGEPADRTAMDLIKDMRENYIDQMTPDEVARMLLHVGANIHQGYINRSGCIFRDGYESIYKDGIVRFEKDDEEISKRDLPNVHVENEPETMPEDEMSPV